jgi:3-phosphoglycerate kinase
VAANRTATSIIGGGDSVSAINQAGVADQITHISRAAELRWSSSKARSCRAWKR